jgi:hypothetical protein
VIPYLLLAFSLGVLVTALAVWLRMRSLDARVRDQKSPKTEKGILIRPGATQRCFVCGHVGLARRRNECPVCGCTMRPLSGDAG